MIVTFTVYFLGGLTIATGEPPAISWPGILIGFFCCAEGRAFGLILKWIGVRVLPLYSRVAPSTDMPATRIEVFPRFGFLAAVSYTHLDVYKRQI